MKKRILKVGAFLSIVTLSTIGVRMANTEQISSVGLVFSNMEALASSSEGGATLTCCAGLWGECKLADGSVSKGPLIQCEF